MRSASKPIQVLPTLLAGLHKKYNLSEEEVTICNSSHWGSNHHIYVLQSIMEKTGLKEEDMIMNPTISTSATPLADKLALGSKLNPVEGKSRLQHCCCPEADHFILIHAKPDSDLPDQSGNRRLWCSGICTSNA